MLRAVKKGLPVVQPLEQDLLDDVLGVVGGVEYGVGQAQKRVGVGLHQPPGQDLVRVLIHGDPSFCH